MKQPTTAEMKENINRWTKEALNDALGEPTLLLSYAGTLLDRLEAAEEALADKFQTFEEWKASVIGIKELADSLTVIALEGQLEAAEEKLAEIKKECSGRHIGDKLVLSSRIQAILESK